MQKRLLAFFLISVVLISTGYVFYGKNWFAQKQLIQKQKSNYFIKNQLKDDLSKLQSQIQHKINLIHKNSLENDLIKYQNIEIKPTFEKSFDKQITLQPIFDLSRFYIVFDKVLSVYQKDEITLDWSKEYDSPIVSCELLDSNRILIGLENGNYISCSRIDGSEFWMKTFAFSPREKANYNNVMQVSIDQYRRLDSSIILIKKENALFLLDFFSGEIKSSYQYDNQIEYVSDYDIIKEMIYFSSKNSIVKLKIEVEN